jgi:hypothetical protein
MVPPGPLLAYFCSVQSFLSPMERSLIAAAICEYFLGVEAVRKSLESITKPLQNK